MKNMHKIMKFEITVGLPGAGKTTYANRRQAEDKNVMIFDADQFQENSISHLLKILKEMRVENENTICIVDGLFLSNPTQELFRYDLYDPLYVYFEADREKCIINDNYRVQNGERSLGSGKLINKAKLDNPARISDNVKVLKTVTPFFDDAVIDLLGDKPYTQEGVVRSDYWVLEGSTYGTCWDEDGPSEPTWGDDEPMDKLEFYQFFSFMKDLLGDKDLTNEEILNKYEHFIEQGSDSEADYYGGCEYQGFWEFNPKYIIQTILKDEHYVYSNNVEEIKETHPEVFMRYLF